MGIPYGREYSATVTASALKLVVCEQCRRDYGYSMERTAGGAATSFLFLNGGGARRSANMVRVLRRRYRSWMDKVAIGLFVASGLCSGAAWLIHQGFLGWDHLFPSSCRVLLAAACFALPGSFTLAFVRWLSARSLDPNAADVEERRELGFTLSASPEEVAMARNKAGHQPASRHGR